MFFAQSQSIICKIKLRVFANVVMDFDDWLSENACCITVLIIGHNHNGTR